MQAEVFYDAVDLLKEMIAIPSVSREETEVANLIEARMAAFGLQPQRHHNNLWSITPGYNPSSPTVLLNAHLDTVKPAEGWETNPFTPVFDSETECLYGLGSNDDGASLVSLMATYRLLYHQASTRSLPANYVFLASAEEEVSGKNGVEAVLPLLPKIDFALVGEPTCMQPAIAEKGLMVLDGVVKGVAGHAARNEGVNAIYKAIPVIETLRNLTLEKESPLLGPVKISVTKIAAGSQHNVVPDRCEFLVDVRTTDAYSNQETLKLIRQAVPECTLTPHSTRLNPSGIAPEHPIVQRAMMLGKTPFGSPTLSDQALMPFPSMKMGPGNSNRSHTAGEHIYLHEIRAAIQEYYTLLA